MKRQTLLMILFAVILLPITYWQASQQQKKAEELKKKQLEEWNKTWVWVENHPDEIHKMRPEDIRVLKSPAFRSWVERRPRVMDALAAIASGIPAQVGPMVGPLGSATPSARPQRRQDFEDAVAKQKPGDWTLTTKTFTASLSATGATVDGLTFNEIKEPSFKPVAEGDKAMKALEPYQLLKVWDPRLKSFALTSNAVTDDLGKAEWLHEEIPGGHRFSRVLPDGDLVLTKEYVHPTATPGNSYDDYHLVLRVSVENKGEKERTFNYALYGPTGLIEPTTSQPLPMEAVVGHRDDHGSFALERKTNVEIFKDSLAGSGSLFGLRTRLPFFLA
ncbi:MAG: hypothetical protein ACAI25_04180, partial [Planctomycetota bacterium]